ncbi:hypothetical protein GCWU000341_01219 [Oribacterium sp. oral taxon 078 str. F0262]|nr:hypothetical protein GCWU000341_01219 [Oribacterium sp. oral taxon 078 str. F0262]
MDGGRSRDSVDQRGRGEKLCFSPLPLSACGEKPSESLGIIRRRQRRTAGLMPYIRQDYRGLI